jgi:hypothetical protein
MRIKYKKVLNQVFNGIETILSSYETSADKIGKIQYLIKDWKDCVALTKEIKK